MSGPALDGRRLTRQPPPVARTAHAYGAAGVAAGRYSFWVFAVDTAGHYSPGPSVPLHHRRRTETWRLLLLCTISL